MYTTSVSKALLTLIILLSTSKVLTQNDSYSKKNDSLSYLSYKELYEKIDMKDTLNSLVAINAYLKRAKRRKDTLEQAEAYHNLFVFNRRKSNNYYADSIIAITKNKHYEYYPMSGYFLKGSKLYLDGDYTNALEYFIKARKSSKEENPDIEKYIGTLKSRLGYYEEALLAYRKTLMFYEKSEYKTALLDSYFNMSDVTRLLKQLDSSLYYCDLGYKLATEIGHKDYQTAFLFNKGMTLSDMRRLKSSQEHLITVLPEIIKLRDRPNTAITHFFIGRNYNHLDSIQKSLYHLKQMDSIVLEDVDINPELREGYQILINHYKKSNDLKQQLTYVTRMLLVDSIINKNGYHLDKKLSNENTRLKLKEERKRLGEHIKNIENKFFYKLLIGGVIIVILLILLVFQYVKRKKDKRKFDLLMSNPKSEKKHVELEIKPKLEAKGTTIDISTDLVDELITKLKTFENELGFLSTSINRDKLAKKMGTNLAYLSKTINHHTGKTYTNYINDLRVDYAIKRLKSDDAVFIKWSVNAIAQEVGFKNTEPFSKAFLRKTGIKPSFFIKELKKHTDFTNSD